MIKVNWIFLLILSILILAGGISIGVFAKNIPIVEFEKKVSVIEVLTLIITVGIGVIFPFLIKKWIDVKQSLKLYLVQEIEELIKEIKVNKSIIGEAYGKGSFTHEDRDNINFAFHSSELQIESLQKQFKVSFPKSESIIETMKIEFRRYKDFLTGGEMMYSSFNKVALPFQREHSNAFNNFESHLKEMIHSVHKL